MAKLCVVMFSQSLVFQFLLLYGAWADTTGYFWHVTDFHYDHTYWTDQLSCNEKVLQPGQFGDYWCDSPWLLVQNSIDNMVRIKPDVDFIIWTGDNVAHIKDANLTLDINVDIVDNITTALNDSFPNVTVYASFGNHDFYPGNQADGENVLYARTATRWSDWIKDEAEIASFKKGGYYKAMVGSKLRLLALNTNLYYTSNNQTGSLDDPADQMAWMTSQFQEAREKGEKVIVTGHIPPGLVTPGLADWFYPKQKENFVDILVQFSDIIVATHFGHDHSDGFKILQNASGSHAVTQFTAPSVTPWRYRTKSRTGDAHNPGIRLVQYDRETGRHVDYVQYYINITDSNRQHNATWVPLYSFRDAYNVSDMSVSSLREIFSRMYHAGVTEYCDKYCTYSLVSNYKIKCVDQVQKEIYCGGLYYNLKDAQDCIQNFPHHNSYTKNHLHPAILLVTFVMELFLLLL